MNKADNLHVALLRGINVGGKNKLPMKELVAVFQAAGGDEVRTYIQSGNVVFRAPPSVAGGVAPAVMQGIADRYGYRVPVIVRTAEALRVVVDANPFVKAGRDPKILHVAFLAARPSDSDIARLDPQRSPPDELAIAGREVYLCFPNGVARTKLTNDYFDRQLSTTSTLRNWRTVLQLRAMTEG